ncbi:hypothetical protein AXF42_Ash017911 [Apostasia shenzhenica]|uniref:Retrotransposon gag domain-containing protein n=1 Tax=Apostasia shenzhenica TaxID=1088818 RepID=A0A2I0AY94_9ASPA|nr:hypothetical protein AXF42_Ash017911 [Apostasia shenzhenica]
MDTIFSSAIMAAPAPRAYKAPRVGDYSGLTDPAQHVKRFENALATSDPVSDAYKCRLFRNTLTGLALDWLDEVPQGSIQNFLQFSEQFRTRFGTSRTTSRTIHELWQIQQAPDESLRNYVERFSKMNSETKDTMDDRSTLIFVHIILPGDLYDSFIDNMPKNASIWKMPTIWLSRRRPSRRSLRPRPRGASPLRRTRTLQEGAFVIGISRPPTGSASSRVSPHVLPLQSTSSKKSFQSSAIKVSSRTAVNASRLNLARTPQSFASSTNITAIFSSSAALFGHSSTNT